MKPLHLARPRPATAAAILLVVQLLLVLSIAGRYIYERLTRPRIWVRATQIDPNLPLRGRYLALQLIVDACDLPRDAAHFRPGYQSQEYTAPDSWSWDVALAVEDGHLVPKLLNRPRVPGDMLDLTLQEGQPCNRVPVHPEVEYFISDTAKSPLPLQPEDQLWVAVTVPSNGPPRPIQLGISTPAGFQPLHLD
jgi:hypothetical protein